MLLIDVVKKVTEVICNKVDEIKSVTESITIDQVDRDRLWFENPYLNTLRPIQNNQHFSDKRYVTLQVASHNMNNGDPVHWAMYVSQGLYSLNVVIERYITRKKVSSFISIIPLSVLGYSSLNV